MVCYLCWNLLKLAFVWVFFPSPPPSMLEFNHDPNARSLFPPEMAKSLQMRWGDKVIGFEMAGLSLHRFILSGIFDIWDAAFHSCAVPRARDGDVKPGSLVLLFWILKEDKCGRSLSCWRLWGRTADSSPSFSMEVCAFSFPNRLCQALPASTSSVGAIPWMALAV